MVAARWVQPRSLLPLLVAGLLFGACGGAAAPAAPASVSYSYDASVTDAQRAEIESAVTQAVAWLHEQPGIPAFSLRIHAAPTADAYVADLGREYSMNAADRTDIRETARSAAALTVGHDVLVVVNGRWQSLGAEKRAFVIAHEIFHVVQYTLASGKGAAPAGRSVPGPAWLVEGSADFVAANIIAASGGPSVDEVTNDYEARAARLDVTLASLQIPATRAAWGADAQYTLGFLASQRLAAERGVAGLLAPWRNAGRGESWGSAFAHAFGQPAAAFERTFDGARQVQAGGSRAAKQPG